MPPTQMQNSSLEMQPQIQENTWAQAPQPTHSIKKVALTLLVLVSLVGASTYAYVTYFAKHDDMNQSEGKRSMVLYDAQDVGISFSHPSGYYVRVRNAQGNENVGFYSEIRNITLVEDTEMNRAIIDGTFTDPVEGPTAITVDVYANPQGLGAESWAQEDTNWMLGKMKVADVEYAGRGGIVLNWDGLYPGKSVVITKDDKAYVFSVTWITPEDQILKDFEMVLNAIVFND